MGRSAAAAASDHSDPSRIGGSSYCPVFRKPFHDPLLGWVGPTNTCNARSHRRQANEKNRGEEENSMQATSRHRARRVPQSSPGRKTLSLSRVRSVRGNWEKQIFDSYRI